MFYIFLHMECNTDTKPQNLRREHLIFSHMVSNTIFSHTDYIAPDFEH